MSSSPATAQALNRRALAWSVARIALSGIALLAFYFLLPFRDVTLGEAVLRLVGGVLLLVLAVGLQIRSIARAQRPQLRSLEAVGLSFWLLVIIFAIVYVSLSVAAPASFTERLSEIDGLYFAVTVIATVGFGDIAAVTDFARVIVTIQMVLGLLLLGVIVRLFIGAGKSAAARQGQP